MPYRRIDLILSAGNDADIAETLDRRNLLDVVEYHDERNGRRHISLLTSEDKAEPIVDRLQQALGDDDAFRVMVVKLSALVPNPEDDRDGGENPTGEDDGSDEEKRSVNRVSRDELLNDLDAGMRITPRYLMLVLLSSVIAAVGLIRDNPALVIGAMMIAPLLLPNMSLALGTTLGSRRLIGRSVWCNAAGVVLCIAFAAAVGASVEIDPGVKELKLRSEATYSDVAVALAAGAAGCLAITSGASANLTGVMVAVALLPPMVAFGLLLGRGDWALAGGAGLLLAVNLACINLAAVATFLLQGVRPGTWYDADRAKRASYASLVAWFLAVSGTVALIWWTQSRG